MRIEWSQEARSDLKRLVAFVAPKNKMAAERIGQQLFAAADELITLPYRGRPSRDEDCRELVVGKHIVIYSVIEPVINILHIFHGRENWTNQEIS
jgi:plasmid stabilization system protein ParE